MKRQFSACQTPRSMYQSILNTFPVIRTVFTYRSPHFCFSWRRPCDYHAICCMDGKTIKCMSNLSQLVLIYLQQFPGYSNRKCKKSPFSRTTGVITLKYLMLYRWKENSMLTNASLHLTITVSEIQRDIGRKSSIFSYPLAFDAPVRGVPVRIAPSRLVR